jgi:hypothetical protein
MRRPYGGWVFLQKAPQLDGAGIAAHRRRVVSIECPTGRVVGDILAYGV